MFLAEKRNDATKCRTCANRSTQYPRISKDEASSPATAAEPILLAAAIEEKEEHNAMTLDVPTAFLQTIPPKNETAEERVIMKLRSILVDALEEIAPEVCSKFAMC